MACPNCGSTNVSFRREKQGEVKQKKGTVTVHATIGMCKDCGFTWNESGPSSVKKRKTWLWVLGWLFIFPVPLTILLLRKKDMNAALKYVILGIAWVAYILIIVIGRSGNTDKGTIPNEPEKPKTEEKSGPTEESATDSIDTIDVTLTVEPNVNEEDGTVLFGVTTNLPEDTKLMVTVSNKDGYTAQDNVVILATGTGYTAEFSENGAALKGAYEVKVTMSIPKLQSESVRAIIGENGEYLSGKYVQADSQYDCNTIVGSFDFEF